MSAVAARDLRNLDLNLLPVLDALLAERNVTRAAERLGVSQPTTSVALQRLRRHFSDDLLRRVGNRYELTPLATQLAGLVPAAVGGVRRVFETTDEFDPATASREFSLVVSDYGATVLGDHLCTLVDERAPGIRLRFEQQTTELVESAHEALRSADGLVLPTGFISGLPRIELYEDSWVIVADADHPEIGESLTMADVQRLPWVVAYHTPSAFTGAMQQLRHLGVEPTVAVVVESFMTVPFLVLGTRRIAVLQARLAQKLAFAAGLRVLPCPWDVVTLTEAFWWHPSLDADPAHRWLRDAVAEAGSRVRAEGCALGATGSLLGVHTRPADDAS